MAGFTEADMGNLLLDSEGGIQQPQPEPGEEQEEAAPEALETQAAQAAMEAAQTGDAQGYLEAQRNLFELFMSGRGG